MIRTSPDILDDPNITGYLLFLESLRHASDLRAFAFEAARRNKPVVAYKLGRSAQAAELALSHTGALAGEDDIAEAFLADCGIARVQNFETLLETLLPLAQPNSNPVCRPDGLPASVLSRRLVVVLRWWLMASACEALMSSRPATRHLRD